MARVFYSQSLPSVAYFQNQDCTYLNLSATNLRPSVQMPKTKWDTSHSKHQDYILPIWGRGGRKRSRGGDWERELSKVTSYDLIRDVYYKNIHLLLREIVMSITARSKLLGSSAVPAGVESLEHSHKVPVLQPMWEGQRKWNVKSVMHGSNTDNNSSRKGRPVDSLFLITCFIPELHIGECCRLWNRVCLLP